MALDFSSKTSSGFALSDTQLMCLQGRNLGFNMAKVAELTGRVPSTLSEHLQRAYHKLGFNKIGQVKIWLQDSGFDITEENWLKRWGKHKFKPVDEIKARTAEQEREAIIHKSMSDAMSAIHEEIGNN